MDGPHGEGADEGNLRTIHTKDSRRDKKKNPENPQNVAVMSINLYKPPDAVAKDLLC